MATPTTKAKRSEFRKQKHDLIKSLLREGLSGYAALKECKAQLGSGVGYDVVKSLQAALEAETGEAENSPLPRPKGGDPIECVVCAGFGASPGRDDSLRCEAHKSHRRCSHPNLNGKPCSLFIDQSESGCRHHRNNEAVTPVELPAEMMANENELVMHSPEGPNDTLTNFKEIQRWMQLNNAEHVQLTSEGKLSVLTRHEFDIGGIE
jgi:hypothetical protein